MVHRHSDDIGIVSKRPAHPIKGLQELSHFSDPTRLDMPVLFAGKTLFLKDLPWKYLPVWMAITIPLFVLIGLLLFLAFFVLINKTFNHNLSISW